MTKVIDWKYHLIELVIVIIGISIAFWLNNLAGAEKEKQLEKQYLSDIRSELIKDTTQLAYNIRFNEIKVQDLKITLGIMLNDESYRYTDSLSRLVPRIGNYDFFSSESFTLTSILQSGDIKIIRSVEIKKELQRLLRIYGLIDQSQKNLLKALDENYFPLLLSEVDMLTQKPVREDFYYSLPIRNYCVYTINDTNNHINEYKLGVRQIQKLLSLIDEELD
ncbi:MAG: hypothetical protein JXQ90_05945 [Cyclobacteriaceae bacterium]